MTQASSPPPETDRGRRWLIAVLALAVLHLGLLHAFAWNPFQDDAYISLRYARNLLEGAGLVFNPGERVEGFTNPLWTLAAAGLLAMKFKGAIALKVLGAACFLGLVASTWRAAQEARVAPVLRNATAALVATTTVLVYWSLSGLETVAFSLAVMEGLRRSLAAARRGAAGDLGVGLSFGVATLLRPEAAAWFALALATLTTLALRRGAGVMRPVAREIVSSLLGFGVLAGGYECFRHAYYGAWLPNTFYAKVEPGGAFVRGLRYLLQSAPSSALVPTVLTVFAARRGWSRIELWLPAALALLHLVFVVVVGGDYMVFGRFVIPVLAPLALSQMVALDALGVTGDGRWSSPRARALVLAALAITAVAGASPLLVSRERLRVVRTVEGYRVIGVWASRYVPRDALIASPAIGAIGYFGRTRMLDTLGLVDAHVARHRDPRVHAEEWAAGHGRGDADYVLRRSPDILLFGGVWFAPEPLTPTTLMRHLDVIYLADRVLLRRPEFFARYEIVNYRVNGLWLGLAVRRDSRCHPDHPAYRGPPPALRGT